MARGRWRLPIAEDRSLTSPSATERDALDAVLGWADAVVGLASDPATGSDGTRKGDVFDFVTPADGLIERFLRAQVAEQFPGHAFLGEEEGGSSRAHGWQWIVDPIDGTMNYSTGLAGATCSIALRRGDDLVLGAIVDLTTRSAYRALAGSGRILTSGAEGEAACRPVTSPAGNARIFLEFGWEDLDPVMVGTIEEIGAARPRAIRMVGGAAYALLNVALHGGSFLGIGLRIWDVAAGIVIAREAGRSVRLWNFGTLVHLVVGTADDLDELAPLVEQYGSRRVAPAI